jgi:pimeloyl-ACP methyl ester carboxylesterase
MQRTHHFLLASALLLWNAFAYGQSIDHPIAAHPRAGLARALGQSSLYFIENHGQVAGPVRYYLLGRDRKLFVGDDSLTIVLEPNASINRHASARSSEINQDAFALRLEFVGARSNALLRDEGTKGPIVNLLTGGREHWRTGLPSYSRLVYKELWPGIDLALIGDTQSIKYEFRVKPGANPDQIRLRYRGGDALRLEPSGDLAVETPLGTLRDQRPFSFQESDGPRVEVKTQYALIASEAETFGFDLASYDCTKPLVIDPAVFVYASYLGGAGEDRGTAIAVDASGAAYITGNTTSSEASFPTGAGFGSLPGADTTYDSGLDAFVAKVQPSGTSLQYVTYIGGNGNDVASGIAVDSAGSAYVTGYTNSGTQFPVAGGLTQSYNGGTNDVFVLKLSSSGTALVYSGFIGGAGDDREPAIALDDSRNVYITGLTYSDETTFPTGNGFGSLPGADQTYNGGADAFVVKVSPDGSRMLYASYIGGNSFDNGYAIGVDAAGNAYVGGNTASREDTFPNGNGVGTIPGPNTTFAGGGFDAFVVKLNAAGTTFSYVAFVGGAEEDRYAPGLAVNRQGSVWITGRTASAEDTFPTGHGFDNIPGFDRTYNGGWDGFVVKINASGTAFDYATYIGGSGNDEIGQAIAVDGGGNAYVTGLTNSTESTFPGGDGFGSIPGPDTTYNGGPHDTFVVKVNAAGTGLAYATYIGGAGGGSYDELGTGIAVTASGDAYVTGYTTSADGFPGGTGFGSLPSFDQSYNDGSADAFIVKISSGDPQPVISVEAGPDQNVRVGATVNLAGAGACGSGTPQLQWRFTDKPSGSVATLSAINVTQPTFRTDVAGSYRLGLTATCGEQTATDYVLVSAQRPPYSIDSNTIAYWRFEENAGNVVADETGNNPGTANGTTIVAGEYGKARHYQRSAGDYITVPDNPALTNLSQITIEAWVFPDSCTFYREEIIQKGTSIAPYNFYSLGAFGCPDNDGTLTFHFDFINQTQGQSFTATAEPSTRHPIQQWYYVVGTYDGVRAKLYVNGVLEATSPDGPAITVTTHDPLFIHNHTFQNGQSNGVMGGIIDEVRISRTARPEGDVAPPTVNAGPDQSVHVGNTVALTGRGTCGSSTPQFLWKIGGRPPGSTADLSATDVPNPTFLVDRAGFYTLNLVATCGSSSVMDSVIITANSCMGTLQLNPEYSAELRPGQTLTLKAFGGGNVYTWALTNNQSQALLSSDTGQSITYEAGRSLGTDVITLTDSICGSHRQLPVVVTSTPQPEILDVEVTPNPTRGSDTIQIEALLSFSDFDRAEVCIDNEFVRPPGGCRPLAISDNHLAATGSLAVQSPTSTSGIPYGEHFLGIRGHNTAGWGNFSKPKHFSVKVKLAVLLLNGYNFCTTGPHPEQWWRFTDDQNRTIACQIRDQIFNRGAASPCDIGTLGSDGRPTKPGTNCDNNGQDPVCVVDNLDGRADVTNYLDPTNNQLVIGNLELLQNYIDNHSTRDFDQYIIIGHSFGGQIARAYANLHPEKVFAILTLDTPHTGAGTPGAVNDLLQDLGLDPVLHQLFCRGTNPPAHYNYTKSLFTDEGADLFNSLYPPDGSQSTTIFPIASESFRVSAQAHCLPGTPFCLPGYITNLNDDIVPIISQRSVELPAPNVKPYKVPVNRNYYGYLVHSPPLSFANNLHNSILEDPNLWKKLFENQIKPILNDILATTPPRFFRRTPKAAPSIMAIPHLPMNIVAKVYGMFEGSTSTASFQFPIDRAEEMIVTFQSSHSDPHVTLISPTGLRLEASSADGLTTLAWIQDEASRISQTILVRRPEVGVWTLESSVPTVGGGAHLPSTGAQWSATVEARSPLTLEVSIPDATYLVGENLHITATILGVSPSSGGSASAVITSDQDESTSTLSLYDDGSHDDGPSGDGTYGGSVELNSVGSYSVNVSVFGDSNSIQFSRIGTAAFSVGVPEVSANNEFTEDTPDIDNDSQLDSLNWSFSINVPRAGHYIVIGDLAAADGSVIATSTTSIDPITTGDKQVILVFDGKKIYQSGRVGPYTLQHLRVTAQTPDGARLNGRPSQTATSGGSHWSWMSFERDESPKFVWTSPVVDSITTNDSFNLQWNVADGNGATTLDLYYDTTDNGFAGTAIVTGLEAVNGPTTYNWDIRSLPDGIYYVYARIRNGGFSDAVYGGSVQKITDTDGDGMADSWESAQGLNPDNASDAYLDPDQDGLANLDEYLNGCGPHNADSDGGGETDGSEVANGRYCSTAADDVTTITLLGVAPNEGDSRGGDTLLVSGSGFQPGATVDFGGTPATSATVINSTRLLVQTPAHAVGTTNVTVSNPVGGGSATQTAAFMFLCQFVELPLVGNNGPLCPGQTLQLASTGLTGATFSWTGPNGFSSTLQNPTVAGAGATASGIYTVTETVGQCVVQGSTMVLIGSAAPVVSIPNGGETWYKNHSYDIQWSSFSGSCSSNVKIEVYKGGVFYGTISSSTVNNGSYSWTVPNSYAAGSDYKIKISDAASPGSADLSNTDFTIVNPPDLIFKNGFESGDTSAWSSRTPPPSNTP